MWDIQYLIKILKQNFIPEKLKAFTVFVLICRHQIHIYRPCRTQTNLPRKFNLVDRNWMLSQGELCQFPTAVLQNIFFKLLYNQCPFSFLSLDVLVFTLTPGSDLKCIPLSRCVLGLQKMENSSFLASFGCHSLASGVLAQQLSML